MTKKLLSLLLAALLLIGLALPMTASAAGYMWVCTPNGGGLNAREAPSTDAKVYRQLAYGEQVFVDYDLGNGWTAIVWGSIGDAYVQTRYLISFDPGPAPTKAAATATPKPTMSPEDEQTQEEAKLRTEQKSEKDVTPFYIEVRTPRATSWVNFRKGPSKITTRLASYPDGQQLIVEGETNRWYRARDPESNVVGYIFKDYTKKLNKTVAVAEVKKDAADSSVKLGTLNVNGAFDLTCKLPESYDIQVVNMRGGKIVATILSQDITKPQLYLSIAYDEMYGDVRRMNDLTDEQLRELEATFTDMNDVEITYQNTGHGTKLLIAREIGSDTDFVDILSIYQGYFIEFNMTPNPNAANQTLTNAQIGMCIDFLTDVDFVPAK